jgi:23S rRNA (adenine1618-N6)-methyltransferase
MKQKQTEKTTLHPRNKHKSSYNFKELINCCPELNSFVFVNQYNNETIDFSDPQAVKSLNKALLKFFYEVSDWNIPENYLCPPIPGRADYIHYMADLLASCNNEEIPEGSSVSVLDIGIGANAVYPLIGIKEYDWAFVGSDIDPVSIQSVHKIIVSNPYLKNKLEVRLQKSKTDIFKGIIKEKERFDLTICNPPFHTSAAEALEGTMRRQKNMGIKTKGKPILNFGGQNNELWCEGGEAKFVADMVRESSDIPSSCYWFSSLLSSKDSLTGVYRALEKVKAKEIKTIEMKQGQKVSRIIAWTFLSVEEQKNWRSEKWKNT